MESCPREKIQQMSPLFNFSFFHILVDCVENELRSIMKRIGNAWKRVHMRHPQGMKREMRRKL